MHTHTHMYILYIYIYYLFTAGLSQGKAAKTLKTEAIPGNLKSQWFCVMRIIEANQAQPNNSKCYL